MTVTIKRPETPEEIRGKAFVHWKSWHEAYEGLVDETYLERFSPETCETIARQGTEGVLIAKDGDNVVGFVVTGRRDEAPPDTREVFAIYVLSAYCGTGVGRRLMEAGLRALDTCSAIALRVLKENTRAIRFYRKFGFTPDGTETYIPALAATEIRMILRR